MFRFYINFASFLKLKIVLLLIYKEMKKLVLLLAVVFSVSLSLSMGRMVMQRIIAACDTVCHFHRFGYVVAYVIFSYKTVNAGFKEYLTHLRVHSSSAWLPSLTK